MVIKMGNYNLFARDYARKTAEEKAEIESRRYYHSLLPSDLQGISILDIGCGSGQDAVYYAEHGAKVQGIDISEEEIKIAQRLGCVDFLVGDMKNLPYVSNIFDIVTSYYALQASDNVPKSLGEIVRVTKPGGTILVLAKHPMRNLLEGWQNDGEMDYYKKRNVTSHIFNKTITLNEPGHTLMEYLNPELLQEAQLQLFEEHSDFPASEQVIPGLNYPTFLIMKLKKM